MMIKKILGTALIVTFVGVGALSAALMDPNTRMTKISELFSKYGADTFKVLNGQGIGATGRGNHHKQSPITDESDVATVINSEDGNSFIMCVADGNWSVYQPQPMKVGSSAMTMTDADGKQLVQEMIAAVRSSPNGKANVNYTALTPDGRKEKRIATVWNSKNLLKRKNDTGVKFICATSLKVTAATQ